MSCARSIVASLQRRLERMYAVSTPYRVEGFLLAGDGLDEVLLVRQEAGGLEVGLCLDSALTGGLVPVDRMTPRRLFGRLAEFAMVVEGVSHFLYLMLRAAQEGAMTQMELEVQAEVDKYVICLGLLWQWGERSRVVELRERLLERVGFRETLSFEERSRYREANRLALGYVKFLERRYIARGALDGLLRELRGSYRMGACGKLEYLEDRCRS